MNRTKAIAIIILTLLASPSRAEFLIGRFECMITQSYHVEIKNGVSKQYIGGKYERYEVGKSFGIEYFENKGSLWLSGRLGVGFEANLYKRREIPKNYKYMEKDYLVGTDQFGHPSYISKGNFNMNSFEGTLRLKQYSKSSWKGIYYWGTAGRNFFSETLAFDCRHTKDVLDDLFKKFKGMGY